MSVPSWGHSSPRLHDFLSNVLYRLAALGDAALEHEFTQDPEEETGASDVWIALAILCWFGLLLWVGRLLVTGETGLA